MAALQHSMTQALNRVRPHSVPPLACALLCGGFICRQAPQALPQVFPSQSQLQEDTLNMATPLEKAP